ncbi:MAG: IS21 family transposase [Myxococcota bacterium]
MYSALTRYTVQRLRRAGVTIEVVREQTGLSERSIRRIQSEPPIDDPADARPTVRIGRPSKAAPFTAFVEKELADQPGVLTIELLRRARLKGYRGGKSAFFDLIKSIRKPDGSFVTRFEGLAGEFTQHDFGTVMVTFVDGTTHRVKFFASRLKWSRFAAVTLVPDETAETLVRTLLEHFHVLGGVPTLAVFDRPKTVALEWDADGRITKWNDCFAQAAMEIGFAAEVCWAYSPNQKGSVERIVGWVKTSFFKQRRFLDLEDLQRQLEQWLTEANEERPSRATGVIPEARRQEELARLRAPRVAPHELATRKPITVGPTGHVTFEGHDFAVDADLTGQSGTLFIHRDKLRITVGAYEVEYPRRPAQKRTAHPAERMTQLRKLTRRGKQYTRRQHLLDLGGATEAFLTELCHESRDWDSSVERLHDLLQHHGEDALRNCFRAAVDVEVYTVDYIASLLREPALAAK